MGMSKSEINKRYEEKKLLNNPYKICSWCKEEKHIEEFDKKGSRRFSQCKKCRSEQYYREADKNRERANEYYKQNKDAIRKRTKEIRRNNKAKEMLKSAKARAIKNNLAFNIDEADIVIPKICPVLGIALETGDGKIQKNSPTLDRIIPSNGYVKGNVIVVSNLANTIKTDATTEQIRMVADFYEKLQSK